MGWSMANHLRTELVLDALEMAVTQRRPRDVIHHSDQRSQYTSLAFGGRCREAGVRPSMGSVGDAHDNAMCESFFATLECELLDRRRFASQAQARMAVFTFIEGFYNPVRLHSALGYRSPVRYEQEMRADPSSAGTSSLHQSGATPVSQVKRSRIRAGTDCPPARVKPARLQAVFDLMADERRPVTASQTLQGSLRIAGSR